MEKAKRMYVRRDRKQLDARNRKMQKLREKGYALRDIGDMFGVTPEAVGAAIKKVAK